MKKIFRLAIIMLLLTAIFTLPAWAEAGHGAPDVGQWEDVKGDYIGEPSPDGNWWDGITSVFTDLRNFFKNINDFLTEDHLKAVVQNVLSGVLQTSFSDGIAELFGPLLQITLKFMLKVEEGVDSWSLGDELSAERITNAYMVVYTLACALILLKFLFKGFQIYVLWQGGDAETNPIQMLIGMGEAAALMVCFPFFYDLMANATLWFGGQLITVFSGKLDSQNVGSMIVERITADSMSLVRACIAIIWLVMVVVLFVQLMARGFELLILRLGVPIACLGLLDSDGGLLKGYMQIFFKTMFTSVIQICLMNLSLSVVLGVGIFNLIAGIAIVLAAFKTPALMQTLLVQSHAGGGITNKMYTASMMARGLGGLLKR